MKLSSLILITFVTILSTFTMATKSHANEETPTWKKNAERWINAALPVIRSSGNQPSRIELIEIEENQLFFRMAGQPGEISMPIQSLGNINFKYNDSNEFLRTLGKVGSEAFTYQDLILIREYAYPKVRFVTLPDQNANFKGSVRGLLEGLIQLNSLDEASYLVSQLEIASLGPEFERLAISLATKLLDTRDASYAVKVVESLDIEGLDLFTAQLVFDFAHSLRKEENYAQAESFYSRLSANKALHSREAELWTLYCGLKRGLFLEDHDFAERIQLTEPGKPSFSLQQLIIGSYYTLREQHDEAMRATSIGIAYATPVEDWTPELMFQSAQTYANLNMTDISNLVFEETILFFPSSKWATAAKEKIDLNTL